ncbi:hypothetical protein QBC35DRAFT_450878 [Podospora australis]|uniref:Uncharacterized protein n=1 Tax=Podospora australis TaxID=1536484 RepID=A0AAN7AKG8_9PEZI|nr:hypothetical protein QBC35DRAFT_450878 [Podospora australis]
MPLSFRTAAAVARFTTLSRRTLLPPAVQQHSSFPSRAVPYQHYSTSPARQPSTSPLPSISPSSMSSSPSRAAQPAEQQPSAEPSSHSVDDGAIPSEGAEGNAAAKTPLPLPAPEDGEKTTEVKVNGTPIALDALGPMVVGRDGSLSRIANWAEMTSFERENTLRILGKRNQLRLGNLREGKPADAPKE